MAGVAAPRPAPAAPTRAVWRETDEEYLDEIAACQEAIREGEAYLLCLTNEAEVAGDFDPFQVHLRLRAASPSHHGALIRIGGISMLSSSPEQFLVVSPDGDVATRPIKGTRARGRDDAEDAAQAHALQESVKERAENLMIVDLMRNDLARVCELGSVTVTELLEVETYPQVHQLVSTVVGHAPTRPDRRRCAPGRLSRRVDDREHRSCAPRSCSSAWNGARAGSTPDASGTSASTAGPTSR